MFGASPLHYWTFVFVVVFLGGIWKFLVTWRDGIWKVLNGTEGGFQTNLDFFRNSSGPPLPSICERSLNKG